MYVTVFLFCFYQIDEFQEESGDENLGKYDFGSEADDEQEKEDGEEEDDEDVSLQPIW